MIVKLCGLRNFKTTKVKETRCTLQEWSEEVIRCNVRTDTKTFRR